MGSEQAETEVVLDGGGPGEVPETLFEEHRGFTSPFIGFVVAVAIGLGWGFAESYGVGLDAGTGQFVLGGVAFLAALLALFAWTPGTSECKSIRINRAGLTVGRQFLPAGEVGHCALLPEYEAGRAALKCRYQDTRIGRRRMSYNYLPNNGPTVFVCQKGRDLARPGWLIASRDPERLLAALTELRADVAGQAR